MTHASRLIMDVWLRNNQTGEMRKSSVYLGDVPVITDRGTFVINGSERVVLNQLVRAPGIYFQSNENNVYNSTMYKGLLLPELGYPLHFELNLEPGVARSRKARCRVKLARRGWVPAITVLQALGIDSASIAKRLGASLDRNRVEWKAMTQEEALAAVGRSWKPDGGGTAHAGSSMLDPFSESRRYSLGPLGRKRVNEKLGIWDDSKQLNAASFIAIIEYLLGLPLGLGSLDNVDSLENRHLRGVGEILTMIVRSALKVLARSTRIRLEMHDDDDLGNPGDFIDGRPFVSVINKFFTSNPLVQFLDQQNPLSELSHRRRITTFGPGGVFPNTAPVEMRDIQPSQIGRMCLIESPEGKNCGMVSYLATHCRIDDDGFMTVPYRKVVNGTVTDEVRYLTPSDDKHYRLAPPDTKVRNGEIVGPLVTVRFGETFTTVSPSEVDMIGIAPQGFISVGSALIPFLEHDDANRSLMGSSMMRQTLPLVRPARPRVGTGVEKIVAHSSGHSILARRAGIVTKVTGDLISIRQATGEKRDYELTRFDRTNQNTVLDQRPIVSVGDVVEAGQIIADGPAIDKGELALGRNLLVAFVPWNGYNYEDAIVVREGLIKDHLLTHIEIEKHSIGVYQTLRGPEILSPELPNVSSKDLEHLDDRGIAKIGSYVQPGDILVAKLTCKEQRALTSEEELIQSIFGRVAEDMADNSLRVPNGSGGRVVGVRIFTPETTPQLKAGMICEIEVLLARLCPLEVGDKLAGRHGNKGIVSISVPDQDMPYLPDGTPVDIILNPLGVPSRMNVGQVLDTQLGFYSNILNRYYRVHQFDELHGVDASYHLVKAVLEDVQKLPGYEWIGDDGKVTLYDGRTGEPYDRPVLIGYQYMLKLNQLVLHKLNARSGLGGPYTAVTQQPVCGKANQGGQRIGEMEVWAIQAYGAAHTLHEMMTIKSDDIEGRHQAYADIARGKNPSRSGSSAAFETLVSELHGLGLDVELGKVIDSFVPRKEKSCIGTELQLDIDDNDVAETVGVGGLNTLLAGLIAGAMMMLFACAAPAFAQTYGYQNPQVIQGQTSQPFAQPMTSSPPPLGSSGYSTTPLPIIPGDRGQPLPPGSANTNDSADMTGGNLSTFPKGPANGRVTVHIYAQTYGRSGNSPYGGSTQTMRGLREVQTLRWDQLTPGQQAKISALFPTINAASSSQQDVAVVASFSQIQQLQNALAPQPQYLGSSLSPFPIYEADGSATQNRQKITQDPGQINADVLLRTPNITPLYNPNWNDVTQHPIPAVRPFARYLVLAGVVSATVMLAFAAWGMVNGHPYAGSRAIATVSGLMLLLMGYTIWKIVQINSGNVQNVIADNANQAITNAGTKTPIVVPASSFNPANVPPLVPANYAAATGTFRSGVPLMPLGDYNPNAINSNTNNQ
jgi:DNA-directed RNA polymerase subunit beta